MDREASLADRVVNLERQMTMFDRVVHMLSSRLESQQKRYNVVFAAQQQQINELNAVVSTLVNEQHSHAELLRDKLSGALHSLSSTAASVSDTIHTGASFSASRTMEPESFFGEILGAAENGSEATEKASVGSRGPYDQQFGPSGDSEANDGSESHREAKGGESRNNGNGSGSGAHGAHEPHFSQSLIGYDDFSQLNGSQNHNHDSRGSVDERIYQDPAAQSSHVAPVVSSERHGQPAIDPSGEMDTGLSENQYLNMPGRKRKRGIFMGNFQFLKSPHSVMEVWQEYTEGINGQPSIKEMESLYQTGWRRDPAVNKRYSRRRVLCKAIETGLNKGYTLEDTVNLLEDYRIIDREKGLKQPIGWLCQGHSIPDALR